MHRLPCRVTDTSGEGFAVRLFRIARADGFVRGFSDQPAPFASEFNKVCVCAHVSVRSILTRKYEAPSVKGSLSLYLLVRRPRKC
jgi:hypothetical protein